MPLASLSILATAHGAWTRLVTYLIVLNAPPTQPAASATPATGWLQIWPLARTPHAISQTALTATCQTVADAKMGTVSAVTCLPVISSAMTLTVSPVQLLLNVPPVRPGMP